MKYVSLIMDVEKSRTYSIVDRKELQDFLLVCVDKLNELFEKDMKFKVTFSAGDELQGLFYDVTSAFMYFRLLEMLIKPVKLRAGIGVGWLTVEIEKGLSTMQDGPVYYYAKEAISDVYKRQFQNLNIYSGNREVDLFANHLANAAITLKRQQVYMQNIVLVMLELLCPFLKEKSIKADFEIARYLLEIKFNYRIGKRKSNSEYLREDKYRTKINFSKVDYNWFVNLNTIKINGNLENAEDYIIKKNTDTIIADILGCSRQNVNSIIQRGGANKIRELDYIALQFIEREYRRELWK